jgi:hypothetical protein
VAFIAGLVFFSAVSGKRMGYLMPLLPFSALAIAWGVRVLADAAPSRWRAGVFQAPLVLFGLLPFAGALAALAVVVAPFVDASTLSSNKTFVRVMAELPRLAPVAGGVAAAVLAGAGLLLLKHRPAWRSRIIAAVCSIAVLTALAHMVVYPSLDWRYSVEPLGAELQRIKPPGDRLVFLNDHKDGRLNYYLNTEHHDVLRAEELAREVDEPGRIWVFALKVQWNDDIPAALKQRFELKISNDFAGTKTQVYAEKAPAR